jgi:acetolactate synthase small subunit
VDDGRAERWAVLVRTNDSVGALARISLVFQRFALNIFFVRIDSIDGETSLGVLVCRAPEDVVGRLARKIGSLVDVLGVEVERLRASNIQAASPVRVAINVEATPRGFDDLSDSLVDNLPPYPKELAARLREFRVARDDAGVSPALTREAASYIERIESENMLLTRLLASHDRA